jgi:mRNA interferase RelE/StbE
VTSTPYRIEYAKADAKQIEKMKPNLSTPIRDAIRELAKDPRPHGFKKLRGHDGLYRIRIGNYRVIYEIRDRELLVLVVRVGDLNEVYWDT